MSASGAVLEAPALVAGLDDLAMVGEPVEQRRGHLGVAGEHAWPFPEGEVGGDHDRGSLVELADQVEQELAARLRERQVAELVEHHEVEPGEMVGDAALAAGTCLGFEPVDEVDDIVEPAPRPVSDAGSRDGDGEIGLAGSGPADEHDVALVSQELAAGERVYQTLVDRGAVEGELGDVLGQGQLGDRHLAADRACLLLGDFGLKQVADDLLRFVGALERDLDDLVVGRLHREELQLAHGGEDVLAFHHGGLLRLS